MKLKYLTPSVFAALFAAVLFGASTPFAKLFSNQVNPILLAGLLYFGSGIGLLLVRIIKDLKWQSTGLIKKDWLWLIGSILFGGILGPALLMIGLLYTSAAMASLLLNLEAVLTALLAWIIFKEHTDKKIILGMTLIVIGGLVLAWPTSLSFDGIFGSIAITCACLCWGVDNNLTRNISNGDALFIAGIKGLVAGIVNISIALSFQYTLPSTTHISYIMIIGFLGYGISLVLFVVALRGLGTARTGAYFSTAPFIGALIAIVFFHETTSALFWIAAIFMGFGVWLHLNEKHEHTHTHEPLFHDHKHYHDEHHQHEHDFPWDGKEPHSHPHQHERLTHSHPHYPDIHHRHQHK
ncbi:DMT family transporter [Thiotrichales bacterium 19X7-9]|nr:DMT family transporter [Thiotrichales bacterium 19X7-9]